MRGRRPCAVAAVTLFATALVAGAMPPAAQRDTTSQPAGQRPEPLRLPAPQPRPPQSPPPRLPPPPIGARDARQEARGNATIRGRVTIAGTDTPVRGATVRAMPRSAGEVLTAEANQDGRFEFAGLAPGRWSVTAEKGGFLVGEFGQRAATGPGTPLTIVGNETHSIAIPLTRGAVIAGQVLDETGEPAATLRVEAMRWTMVNGRRTLTSAGMDQTDDTGAYRIHSLPPGDYVVEARTASAGLIRIESSSFPGGGTVRVVHSTDAAAGRSVAPTYFPGTASVSEAQRVMLRPGEERLGVSFGLTGTTLARISGTVVSSSGAPLDGQVTVSLLDATGAIPGPLMPGSRRQDGSFELRDVAPGSYTLVATLGSAPSQEPESAILPVVVTGDDISGLTLITRRGGRVRGTVTGDGGVPDTSGMNVYVWPLIRGAFPLVDLGATVRDGRFEIANVATGGRLMTERMPKGWMLKAITIGDVDVTDAAIEFDSGTDLTANIVLTNRLTRLGGVVTENGKPAGGITAVVFPADPSKWSFPSRFVASVTADDTGNYAIPELPPFDSYLAAAVPAYERGMEQDPAFLEILRSTATPFSLAEGESKRLNLVAGDR